MKIIVTGGAGFIGSACCRYLINHTDASVVNVDALTYAANLSTLSSVADSDRYELIHADITDRKKMDEIFAVHKPDAVMHLAAESHVDRSISGAAEFIKTNIVGTYELLDAALEYWKTLTDEKQADFRFLHVSTDEVYGSLEDDGLFTEDTSYDPSSPYSASKAASDHLVRAWQRTYGLPVLVSNCSNNYGPYQFPEKLIPLMILNCLDRNPLPVYGDGSNVRDWLYVDDHARALHLIMTQGVPGQTYNVGGRNERSNMDVVNGICAILDKSHPKGAPHTDLVTYVDDRPGHDWRYAIDATRLETDLGWKAQENFETGLEKTVAWYLDNATWWQPLQKNVYQGERLGLITAAKA